MNTCKKHNFTATYSNHICPDCECNFQIKMHVALTTLALLITSGLTFIGCYLTVA